MGNRMQISLLVGFFIFFNCGVLFFFYFPHLLISPGQIEVLQELQPGQKHVKAMKENSTTLQQEEKAVSAGTCNIFIGKWQYDPSFQPLYTENTCKHIYYLQNCFKNGRPDREFLKWRWKPDGCDLPTLDPWAFLVSMRGKRLVFVGDSLARNHMQSLLCTLAQVEEPVNINNTEKEMKWVFPGHNFHIALLWSTFLVEHLVDNAQIFRLQLDVPDFIWASQLNDYNIAIVSSGYWYMRSSIYYMNEKMLGCSQCSGGNFFDMLSAYRLALENMLRYWKDNFKGLVILRTMTVDHFENGSWATGGYCNRTSPHMDLGRHLPWLNNEMYKIQLEAFDKVGSRLMKLINVTPSVSLRPDGHANLYGMLKPVELPRSDCLHWCLPGPIDAWNDLLSYILAQQELAK